MTPEQIAGLGLALTEFLGFFRTCFGERRVLDHFAVYCRGLLSNLRRKSVEPVALAAGSTVRALQLFLAVRGGSPDPPRRRRPAAARKRSPAAGQESRRAMRGCSGNLTRLSLRPTRGVRIVPERKSS